MARWISTAVFLLVTGAASVTAQFVPMLLQNGSYWDYRKSEFDSYDADFKRDGQSHKCELLMIFTAQGVDAKTLEDLHDPRRPNAVPVIQMKQIATIPRGLVTEQRSTTAWWRADLGSLAQIAFSGTDSVERAVKNVCEKREGDSLSWTFRSDTSRGRVDSQQIALPTGTVLFYDELPLRARMLDFSKASGELEVQLAATLTDPGKDFPGFKPAKISWKIGEREIAVDLKHDAGKDHLVLDRDFPFLLREWHMPDGSRMKMTNSLRVEYRNYMKNGDRERALKDPMLRHPD